MGSRAVDHEQVLGAVVAALAKSSSRVADCNSDSSAEFTAQQQQQQQQQDHDRSHKRASRSHHHHNLFSCFFTGNSGKIVASRQLSTWPRSPSRIMSRLLLSPGISPDNRILAGDQSPARLNSKLRSLTFYSPRRIDRSEESRDEPTSPKVTCMGTVKAPKSKSKAQPQWPPRKNNTHQSQNLAARKQDSHLDLSRLEHRSGELRRSSRPHCEQQRSRSSSTSRQAVLGDCRKNPSNSSSTHQEQCDANPDPDTRPAVARSRSRSLPVEIEEKPRGGELEVRSSRSTELKRPEEVCLWRRRCVAEPLRLAIAENSHGQQKSILVNGPSSAL